MWRAHAKRLAFKVDVYTRIRSSSHLTAARMLPVHVFRGLVACGFHQPWKLEVPRNT
jgi:hypothetical protein